MSQIDSDLARDPSEWDESPHDEAIRYEWEEDDEYEDDDWDDEELWEDDDGWDDEDWDEEEEWL